jgi:hypothetical protein
MFLSPLPIHIVPQCGPLLIKYSLGHSLDVILTAKLKISVDILHPRAGRSSERRDIVSAILFVRKFSPLVFFSILQKAPDLYSYIFIS